MPDVCRGCGEGYGDCTCPKPRKKTDIERVWDAIGKLRTRLGVVESELNNLKRRARSNDDWIREGGKALGKIVELHERDEKAIKEFLAKYPIDEEEEQCE